MSFIEEVLTKICDEEKISLEKYCDGYCFKLSKNNNFTFIYDNIFELNSASTYKILKDKSAVFEILTNNNIPSVEHFFYMQNSNSNTEIINSLNNKLKTYKNLVLKYNEGMSGNDVYLINNSQDLQTKAEYILKKFNSLTASPFYNIEHEYRVIILNGEVKIVFDKIRPYVIGDGKNTIKQLTSQKYKNNIKPDKSIDLNIIPGASQKVILSWRHNLNFGAIPEIISDKNLLNKLENIAKQASQVLKIRFASVDIIETTDKKLKVLEINGSVTMGKFASFSKSNYDKAKDIYKEALLTALNIKKNETSVK